jgi:DeoR/GlpR family transcriptional regulator of sugar metabolism
VAGPDAARARRDEIATLIEQEDRVSVGDLAARYGVTDASIRRDLAVLQDEGRIRRVHGGAVGQAGARALGAYVARARERRQQKDRIGIAAAGLIRPGDVVLFDSGTTVAQVAAHVPSQLRRASAITTVTHSLPVVAEVGDWEGPHLVCLGGLYLPEYQALVGPQTVAQLSELSADLVFLGCDGLTVEQGITTPHVLVAQIGSTMAGRARRVIAVADASKLGRSGFTPIVPLAAVHVLITDEAADPEQLARIRAAGVEVILA